MIQLKEKGKAGTTLINCLFEDDNLQLNFIYRVSQKKYTSLKSYSFVLRTDKSLNCVSFVIQGLNLNFET